MITTMAPHYGVPTWFALRIAKIESGYNPHARGSHGELGVFQIKCQTARGIGYQGACSGLLDARTGVAVGLHASCRWRIRVSGGNLAAGRLQAQWRARPPQTIVPTLRGLGVLSAGGKASALRPLTALGLPFVSVRAAYASPDLAVVGLGKSRLHAGVAKSKTIENAPRGVIAMVVTGNQSVDIRQRSKA